MLLSGWLTGASVMAGEAGNIGQCHSCQNLFCPKPKMRIIMPSEGCSDWMTPRSRLVSKNIKTMKVKKVKE